MRPHMVVELDTEKADKKNIYITCGDRHPRLAHELGTIAAKAFDCIYRMEYKLDDSTRLSREDREFLIDRMDMVMIAVTEDFLTEDCDARLIDFERAVKKGIPILPVLCEQGIEWQFGEVCGHYQLLNGLSDGFAEALGEFLAERFWTEGSSTESPKDIFAVKAFLSYRKKDRREAVALLERLQHIPGTLDTEIWFDDFLINGENYDNDIDRALRDSDYVLLAVTPSLFEEKEGIPNYVEAIEYPNAIAYGKQVIGIELVPTDHEEFFRRFPRAYLIPFSEAPEDALSQLYGYDVRKPMALQPDKIFRLGAAYLDGKRVFRNVDAGLYLLRTAGENGSAAAYEKLSAYYRSLGSREDRETALIYLGKCIGLLKEEADRLRKYYLEGLTEVQISCAELLLGYGELCRELNAPEELSGNACRDYLNICRELKNRGVPESERINVGNAFITLAGFALEDGNTENALLFLENVEKSLLPLMKAENRLFPMKQYSRYWFFKGLAEFRRRRFEKASEHLEKAIGCIKWLAITYRTGYGHAVEAADLLFRTGYIIETAIKDESRAEQIYYGLRSFYNDVLKPDIGTAEVYCGAAANGVALAYAGLEVPDAEVLKKALLDAEEAVRMSPQTKKYTDMKQTVINCLREAENRCL